MKEHHHAFQLPWLLTCTFHGLHSLIVIFKWIKNSGKGSLRKSTQNSRPNAHPSSTQNSPPCPGSPTTDQLTSAELTHAIEFEICRNSKVRLTLDSSSTSDLAPGCQLPSNSTRIQSTRQSYALHKVTLIVMIDV